MRGDLLILLIAFAAASAIAGLLGAVNLGTALTFGQGAFAVALVYVIARRPGSGGRTHEADDHEPAG